MYTITAIEEQKKNKRRYSIFINGDFFIGVNQDVLAKLNLFKGKQVDKKELTTIIQSEEYNKAKFLVLRYLTLRPRTRFELNRYLKNKGFDQTLINKTLKTVDDMGLINDDDYAQRYALELIKKGKDGYGSILNKLFKRGIKAEKAKTILNDLIKEDEEFQTAIKLANKKLKSIKHKEKSVKIRSINSYLIRKGFSFDIVNKVIRKLFKDNYDSES